MTARIRMLEVEVLGTHLLASPLPPGEVERLCALALASADVRHGHLAVEFVQAERIAELNREHRQKEGPTDVLSFPLDGVDSNAGSAGDARGVGNPDDAGVPVELGDIVICPEHTVDICEAIVHGALHIVGMDHETDEGEMLAVQSEIMRWSKQ